MQVAESEQSRREQQFVEIDPFGCPYCGGPVVEGPPQCSHCGRSVELRLRRRPGGAGLGWLIAFLLVLGVAAWMQGLFVAQMVRNIDQLPEWLDQTIFTLVIGTAFFEPDGIEDELAEIAELLTQVQYVLAGLSVVAAVGLALRNRVAYFATFFLLILTVAAAVAGLLTGLGGWVPAILLFGLVAFAAKWLADMAPVFEWLTRAYNADLDGGLKTHVDYYNRGQQYAEMRMWAKAAAHWRSATQLSLGQPQYHAALARAFAELEYVAAARAAVERARALDPEDEAIRALLRSLIESEESR
jgi:hypothetical protein